VTSDVRLVALTLRERFVFFPELIGRLRERSFMLQRAGAVFSAYRV
jgi:hypothetical protein